uniref:Uncharacterized protein n=1 Tax=Oryza brachyantha TaxID=4533 RepID=J3LN41_ORYBR
MQIPVSWFMDGVVVAVYRLRKAVLWHGLAHHSQDFYHSWLLLLLLYFSSSQILADFSFGCPINSTYCSQ